VILYLFEFIKQAHKMAFPICWKGICNLSKEKCMYFLLWIIVGLVGGWSAGKALKGRTYGALTDIAMGICGAVVGGVLMGFAGFGGYGRTIVTTLVAMMGAVLLTLLVGLVNGRRIYARQP
jgi:uncharacterized membrane protein YeaQ/YmgE (transglycosylase-associated protein family)